MTKYLRKKIRGGKIYFGSWFQMFWSWQGEHGGAAKLILWRPGSKRKIYANRFPTSSPLFPLDLQSFEWCCPYTRYIFLFTESSLEMSSQIHQKVCLTNLAGISQHDQDER
jgi:hypothetical protein